MSSTQSDCVKLRWSNFTDWPFGFRICIMPATAIQYGPHTKKERKWPEYEGETMVALCSINKTFWHPIGTFGANENEKQTSNESIDGRPRHATRPTQRRTMQTQSKQSSTVRYGDTCSHALSSDPKQYIIDDVG